MEWDVEYTDEFGRWWDSLPVDDQKAIEIAVRVLAERCPGLGRPLVDTIRGSKHPNMKELRPLIANIRILFAFDPRRTAILLIGGDKTNRWSDWYTEMVPIADQLYDEHLIEIRGKESR